jgi:hypothetical protein
MGRLMSLAVLSGVVVGGSGCATLVHGPRQTVTVTSDPSGAAVTVLSGSTVKEAPGVTPVKVRLPRRDANLTLRLEKAGCAPTEVKLKRSVSGWTFGNLIAANPFAQQGMDSSSGVSYAGQLGLTTAMFTTDFLTGGAYKLPKAVDVRFCSSAAGSPERF